MKILASINGKFHSNEKIKKVYKTDQQHPKQEIK